MFAVNFTVHTPAEMGLTGIASFAKSPLCTDLTNLQADIAVLGAPCDIAVQGKPGARMGPRAIRDASTGFRMSEDGFYDPERDDYFLSARRWKLVDCGDADYVPGDLAATFDNIENAVRLVARSGALPVVLGGDHSVSIPVSRGLDEIGDFNVIHIDAHLDWTSHCGDALLFNGCPCRRMAELPYVKRMFHLGIRGTGSSKKSDYDDARSRGDVILSPKAMRAMGWDRVTALFPRGEKYYVTIDIDGFDAVLCPGTGAPSFGGLLFDEVMALLEGAAAVGQVIAVDLVEVAPPYDDRSGTTAQLAATTLMNFLGYITKARE
jgi:agmatinase